MWYCNGMSSVVLWGERAFMASWELGQGQIPSLGERVEHRGLLYHDDDDDGGGFGDSTVKKEENVRRL